MSEKITSTGNQKIKDLMKLNRPAERKIKNQFIIEGFREVQLALKVKAGIVSIYICPEIIAQSVPDYHKFFTDEQHVIEVSREVYRKIAYRDDSNGIIAVAEISKKLLSEIKPGDNPLIIVLESVEKPGNLGAVLRTADAANVDAVIICDPQTDIFNPNVVRSSLGCLFTNQVASCSNQQALEWLKANDITLFAAAITKSSVPYHKENYKIPSAIIMGTEATGLSEFWLKHADKKIIIPMSGKVDSLNVSTSTAILVYEAKRQRDFM
ncbi:MAG: RNA methyltransferase [Bacteroidota bacterium]